MPPCFSTGAESHLRGLGVSVYVFATPKTIFASICEAIHARDAASLMGLGMYDTGNREDLLHINPDVIIMPSNIFDKDATYESYTENLYSDPALQDVKAVAQAVYGYHPVVSTH